MLNYFVIMKRIVPLILFLIPFGGVANLYAQSNLEEQKAVIAERKDLQNLTEADLKARVTKKARKDAKALAREGWKPMPGTADLAQQLSEVRFRQYALAGKFPKYIVGRGSSVAATPGMARKQALARARADVAATMSVEIAALTESTESTTELTGGEAETIAKTVETSKSMVQQSLGRTDAIMEIYREKDGKAEVQIAVSYDGGRAKAEILKLFGEEEKELKAKLEKLLDGAEQ